MKYLLSNGKTTENLVVYIKDVILLNMLLLPKEIPYFSGGSKELITDILEENLKYHVSDVVNTVVNRVRSLFSDVKIEVGDIIVESQQVKVNVIINGLTETYEIKRFN